MPQGLNGDEGGENERDTQKADVTKRSLKEVRKNSRLKEKYLQRSLQTANISVLVSTIRNTIVNL